MPKCGNSPAKGLAKNANFDIPGQRTEISRVGLIIIVDDMPVGVVHLNALPKSVSIAQLLNHMSKNALKK